MHYFANNVVVILFNWIERRKKNDFANECYARKNRHRFSIRLHLSSFALVNENQTNVTLFIESIQTEKARAWKRAKERKWRARAKPAATTTTTKNISIEKLHKTILCAHDRTIMCIKSKIDATFICCCFFSLSLNIFTSIALAHSSHFVCIFFVFVFIWTVIILFIAVHRWTDDTVFLFVNCHRLDT